MDKNTKKIYFLTNRFIDPSVYIGEWNYPYKISTGEVLIEKKNNNYVFYKDSNNDSDASALDFYPGPEDKCISGLFNELNNQTGDIIIYIHGYSKNLYNALGDSASIFDRLNAADQVYSPNIVLFSWPSYGRVAGDPDMYTQDRKNAVKTRFTLSYVLELLYNIYKVSNKKLHLIAHSMGNYVLRNGLNEFKRKNNLVKIFKQILLVAADEDNDALLDKNKLMGIESIADRITVYYNNNDGVLKASQNLYNKKFPRLGKDGPKSNNLPSNIKTVNVTNKIDNQHEYLLKGNGDNNYFLKDVVSKLKGE